MKKILILLTIFGILFSFSGCSKDKLVPNTDDNPDAVIHKMADVNMLLVGAYNYMSDYRYYGRNMIIAGEVRADNVFSNGNSGRFTTMGEMNLLPETGDVGEMMQYMYGACQQPNIILNNTSPIDDEDPALLAHYQGEAHAIRALVHFDLLRLFGQQHVTGQGGMNSLGVSYVKNFRNPLYVERSTVAQNLADIYSDLDMALTLMNSSYDDTSKFRITKNAVYAIKARVATYFKDYPTAKVACEAILNAYSVSSNFVTSWTGSSASSNTIFGLAYNTSDNPGINGLYNIYNATSYGDIQVLNQFVSDAEFSATDVRSSISMIKTVGGKLRNVGKYKTSNFTDYIRVFRYEEVVLNYAEAIMDTNPTLALTYLNSIPQSRNGSTYTVANIDNILKERRKEFAFEGFRFFDLARTNRNIPVLDPVYQTHGGPSYGSFKYAFPIPIKEINNNPYTVQNYGYGQ